KWEGGERVGQQWVAERQRDEAVDLALVDLVEALDLAGLSDQQNIGRRAADPGSAVGKAERRQQFTAAVDDQDRDHERALRRRVAGERGQGVVGAADPARIGIPRRKK